MLGEASYEGAHSITFSTGEKETEGPKAGYLKGLNTWDAWHLIPTSKPIVAGPQPRTNYIEIPGRDGAIDFSTYLTGNISYGPRSGSWEFAIDNGWEGWEAIRQKLYQDLHGKEYWIVLEDNPTWYWVGRVSISDYKPESNYNAVTINYVVEPRCYSIFSGEDSWLWDPFNFETDYTDGTGREPRL